MFISDSRQTRRIIIFSFIWIVHFVEDGETRQQHLYNQYGEKPLIEEVVIYPEWVGPLYQHNYRPSNFRDLYGTRPSDERNRRLWTRLMNSFRKGNVFRPSVVPPTPQTPNGIELANNLIAAMGVDGMKRLAELVGNLIPPGLPGPPGPPGPSVWEGVQDNLPILGTDNGDKGEKGGWVQAPQFPPDFAQWMKGEKGEKGDRGDCSCQEIITTTMDPTPPTTDSPSTTTEVSPPTTEVPPTTTEVSPTTTTTTETNTSTDLTTDVTDQTTTTTNESTTDELTTTDESTNAPTSEQTPPTTDEMTTDEQTTTSTEGWTDPITEATTTPMRTTSPTDGTTTPDVPTTEETIPDGTTEPTFPTTTEGQITTGESTESTAMTTQEEITTTEEPTTTPTTTTEATTQTDGPVTAPSTLETTTTTEEQITTEIMSTTTSPTTTPTTTTTTTRHPPPTEPVVVDCDETIIYENATWQSSNLFDPELLTPNICVLTIKLNSSDRVEVKEEPICQIRLDFKQFTIAQPNRQGNCVTDNFRIFNAENNTPIICGDNPGQHLYLKPRSRAKEVRLVYKFGLSTVRRFWNIRVTLVPCCANHLLAPADCLQYFNDYRGIVKSFNWIDSPSVKAASNHPRQLANQHYNICFEADSSAKTICYTPCQSTGLAFSLSQNALRGPFRAGVGVTDCSDDFLLIANGYDKFNKRQRNDRFCGTIFNPDGNFTVNQAYQTAEASTTICSDIKPFQLHYTTNNNELPVDVSNNGFCLEYKQDLTQNRPLILDEKTFYSELEFNQGLN